MRKHCHLEGIISVIMSLQSQLISRNTGFIKCVMFSGEEFPQKANHSTTVELLAQHISPYLTLNYNVKNSENRWNNIEFNVWNNTLIFPLTKGEKDATIYIFFTTFLFLIFVCFPTMVSCHPAGKQSHPRFYTEWVGIMICTSVTFYEVFRNG